SPASPELFKALSFGVVKMLGLLIAETDTAGLSPEQMAEHRANAEKLVLIAPAALGAASLDKLVGALSSYSDKLQAGELAPQRFTELANEVTRGAFPTLLSESQKAHAFGMMEKLAKNTSLDEPTLLRMRALSAM